MKALIKVGTTSKRLVIFVPDSSSTVGAGLTGLTNASSGLAWYYWREDTGNAGGTSVSPVSATRGTFTSGGFKEIDATNLPGFYEIGVPDAVLASGATWAVMMLRGVTNMAPVKVEIQLVAFDPTDSVRLGITALPNAAAGASGGLATATNSSGEVKIQAPIKKNTALTGFQFVMIDSGGTPTTGLTVAATRSIDGGTFASCTNSVTELANGWYKITLSTSDLNGTVIALRFSASGARDTNITLFPEP